MESTGADSITGLKGRLGNGNTGHGDDDSNEGLHFDGGWVAKSVRLKGDASVEEKVEESVMMISKRRVLVEI